jgi:ABC-type phosphate transport system substrate-binding protein
MTYNSFEETEMRTLKTAVVGALTLTLALGAASAAQADPTTPPLLTDIVGVGSDTTEEAVSHISSKYNEQVSPTDKKLYSWDATSTVDTIVPKVGCTPIQRPHGSSAGIAAMKADQGTNGEPCIDFARSSRAKKADGSEAGLAFLAMGQDGVSWVSQSTTHAPASLTTAQLAAIYKCDVSSRSWDQVGGTGTSLINPHLPQPGSGTRDFFLKALGLTEATVGSCVTADSPENNGAALPNDPDLIAPYSIAKYIAQAYNGHDDKHGTTVLGQIDGISPTVGSGSASALNFSFPSQFQRQVYNVVKKDAQGNVPDKYAAIFGANGFLCKNQNLVSDYGFGELGTGCGAVS